MSLVIHESLPQRIIELVMGRSSGPLTLRLILQPSVASLFAIRAGLADARAGRPPYLWTVLSDLGQRRALLASAWKDVRKLFLMALTLDCVYQVIEFKWIFVGQALIVACVLAILPYVIVRGLVTRLARLGKPR
jgi:hypothetical protein